jgi:hypothetical protein
MSDGNSHFMMAIGRAGFGEALTEADQKLTEAIQAVRNTGKQATVSITLKIKPNGSNGRAFEVVPTVKATLPAKEHGKTFFWSDSDDQLTRAPGENVQLTHTD